MFKKLILAFVVLTIFLTILGCSETKPINEQKSTNIEKTNNSQNIDNQTPTKKRNGREVTLN